MKWYDGATRGYGTSIKDVTKGREEIRWSWDATRRHFNQCLRIRRDMDVGLGGIMLELADL